MGFLCCILLLVKLRSLDGFHIMIVYLFIYFYQQTYFVRMKRIKGEPMAFKKTCEKLTEKLVL